MNNKLIIGLAIGIILAIGILCLMICKNKEMKNWILKSVCCCFGKKNGEYKNVEDSVKKADREASEEYNKGMFSKEVTEKTVIGFDGKITTEVEEKLKKIDISVIDGILQNINQGLEVFA